jgi:hypothetical protein
VSPAEYLTGLSLLGVVLTAFWLSGRHLRLWLVPAWTGAPAALAGIVLALAVAVVTAEALGLLGLLDVPFLVAAAVAAAAGLRRWGRRGAAAAGAPPAPRSESVAVGLALLAALATAIHWAGPVLQSLDVGIYRQDSLWYHLPSAAWFAQTGSIDGLLFTDTLKLTVWYYPLNSELLHSLGMVLLGNDLLSPTLNFGWMSLALLSAWCVGRPFGLAPVTLLAAVLVVNSDMMLVQAGNAPSDIVALACLLAAIAVVVNGCAARSGAERGGGLDLAIDRGPLAVAALAAGLAVGTKVTMLIPVAAITVAVIWRAREEIRSHAAIWLGGLLATGGFWYLRNLAHAGNPLPWLTPGPLPGPSQEALYPRPAHSIVEYIADRHAWTEYFLPGLGDSLGPLWPAVAFAVFAGMALGLRRRNGRLIQVIALAGAATLIAHVFNPISASGPEGGPYGFASNLRYAAPGMAIGLLLLPLCESRRVVRYVLTPAFAVLALAATLASTEWTQPQPAVAATLGATAVLLPFWLLRGTIGRRQVGVAVVTIAAVALAGYPQQRQYFEDRYRVDVAPPLDNPGFRTTPQWQLIQTWAREQHGEKIGIVGTPAAYGQYLFYGEDLSNEVRYLGEPGAHGGLTAVETCGRWRRLIDRGRFDQIVVTPEDPGSPLPPPQLAWTALDGTALATLPVPPAAVFTLTAPLNPAHCPYGTRPSGLVPFGSPPIPGLPPGVPPGPPGSLGGPPGYGAPP